MLLQSVHTIWRCKRVSDVEPGARDGVTGQSPWMTSYLRPFLRLPRHKRAKERTSRGTSSSMDVGGNDGLAARWLFFAVRHAAESWPLKRYDNGDRITRAEVLRRFF